MKSMTMRGLLLGAAAGLVAMSSASAADLSVKAKPVHSAKISGYYMASNGAGITSAFYFQATFARHDSIRVQLDQPVNKGGAFSDYSIVGMLNGVGTTNGRTKSSNFFDLTGADLDANGLAQKLMSSTAFYGSPSHGFTNLSSMSAAIKKDWTDSIG